MLHRLTACSDTVEDEEEGEETQGSGGERDQAGAGGFRLLLCVHAPEHEESEVEGVQGATQIHQQVL